MPDPGDLEAIAHLVGATNAQLKSLDEQIVSSSTNLNKSNENWDPQAVIKEAAHDLQLISQAPQPAAQPEPMQVQVAPAQTQG